MGLSTVCPPPIGGRKNLAYAPTGGRSDEKRRFRDGSSALHERRLDIRSTCPHNLRQRPWKSDRPRRRRVHRIPSNPLHRTSDRYQRPRLARVSLHAGNLAGYHARKNI